VALTKAERNQLIADLYHSDGMTQKQIAELVGLSREAVRDIIGNGENANAEHERKNSDKRVKITEQSWPAL
jgi:predicted transcriptional regulator